MPANYTVDSIRPLIIFSAKMGSHAYGTSLPSSDVDIRGVFIQPLEDIFKYGFVDQVADDTNDIIYYELKRFLSLVKSNNPNILELLNAPEDCVLHKDPIYDLITENAEAFITKKCRMSFAGYAIGQIKKARGYNKKINWEESQMVRKTVLDFCYILYDGGTMPFKQWLKEFNEFGPWKAEYDPKRQDFTYRDFSLAAIDHAHDLYSLYAYEGGIVSDEEKANDVQLTSIPKFTSRVGYLTFNKDAYSVHCKKYKEYKEWLENRNEDRFKMNKEHGKNYDSKNMSHCVRLLDMALEIGEGKGIIVRRPEEHRKLLLSIRHGEMDFDNLLEIAEAKITKLDETFDKSDLPDKVSDDLVSDLELRMRKSYYNLK